MNRDLDVEMMKRGGKKKKAKRSKVKASQQQIVNVKVKVGDTVQLYPDRLKPKMHQQPTAAFRSSYDPVLEPRRLAGPGFMFANAPLPSRDQSYAVAPFAINPIMAKQFIASSDPSGNMNQNKADDLVEVVNPSGIKPTHREERGIQQNATPATAFSGVSDYSGVSDLPFEGKQVGPSVNVGRNPEVRVIQNELPPAGDAMGKNEAVSNVLSRLVQTTLPESYLQRPPGVGGESSGGSLPQPVPQPAIKKKTSKDDTLLQLKTLYPAESKTALERIRKEELQKLKGYDEEALADLYGTYNYEEALAEELGNQIMAKMGNVMARGGPVEYGRPQPRFNVF